jgi:streptogramin lyase
MNNNHKAIKQFFLFLVLLASFGLKAQTAATYFGLSQNVNAYGLATNSKGDFYYVDDSNGSQTINKVDANGVVSIFVSGNYNIQNNSYNNPEPMVMDCDTSGNLYFIDQNDQNINKVMPDGFVTTFVSGYNPMSITCDNSGNLYFIDQNNWPYSINKVDSDGNVSSFFSDNNYNPGSLTCDNSGNLYFLDQNNWPNTINKIDSDGNVSLFVIDTDYSPKSITTDTLGNLYFIDQNNWPNSINKVDSDGNVSPYVSDDPNMNNPNNLVSDSSGNLYFLENNGQNKITTILNPVNPCVLPGSPTADSVSVCKGNPVIFVASGIGEIKWYDAPSEGNLLGTGNNFTTSVLTTDATYYVEGFLCVSSASRTPVTVTVLEIPVASISGVTSGNDFVTLTASGNGTYVWSGGYSSSSDTNIFYTSGTYSVTVTNPDGCSDTAFVNVVVNKMGLNKFGQLITEPLLRVNKNGSINSTTYLNKHGKSASSIPVNSKLNYTVFSTSASYANNAADFLNFTNSSNVFSSGSYSASLLLNWTQSSFLSSVGIQIPNRGERFALVASGFFVPEESGTYTFTCEGDDAVDLFINNVNVVNHYGIHGIYPLGTHTGTINLVAGTKYVFRARQQENDGAEGLRVYWRRPSETIGWNIYTSELSTE